MGPRFTSGGQSLERHLSSGRQVYQLQEKEKDPLYVPMTKAAAKLQVFHKGVDLRSVTDIFISSYSATTWIGYFNFRLNFCLASTTEV